jgi:MFS transporter, MFS domain-containing protein family, molybdate-anion transporter
MAIDAAQLQDMGGHLITSRHYALHAAGDWLQGPYIYCLYEHYGYSVGDIGRFFIAGFASSMLFGTLAGVLADK